MWAVKTSKSGAAADRRRCQPCCGLVTRGMSVQICTSSAATIERPFNNNIHPPAQLPLWQICSGDNSLSLWRQLGVNIGGPTETFPNKGRVSLKAKTSTMASLLVFSGLFYHLDGKHTDCVARVDSSCFHFWADLCLSGCTSRFWGVTSFLLSQDRPREQSIGVRSLLVLPPPPAAVSQTHTAGWHSFSQTPGLFTYTDSLSDKLDTTLNSKQPNERWCCWYVHSWFWISFFLWPIIGRDQ